MPVGNSQGLAAVRPPAAGARSVLSIALSSIALLSIAGCVGPWTYRGIEERTGSLLDDARDRFSSEQAERMERALADDREERQLARDKRIRRELGTRYPDLTELSLDDALAIAVAYNREFESERESNSLSALSLFEARRAHSPQLSASASATFEETRDGATGALSNSAESTAGIDTDWLSTWGTQLNISVADSADASVSITQPLLGGAGRLVNRESLTQAERSLVYRLRSHELFRQSFTIRTMRQYYDLARRIQVTANTKASFEEADFLYRRSQALFKSGRTPEIDVFQAEQQRLQAKNDLADARESYQDALLAFKTHLGIPVDIEVGISAKESVPFQSVEVREARAIRLAHALRLDFATARDRVDDLRRGVRIARRSQLPGLSLSFQGSAPGSDIGSGAGLDDYTTSASLSLTVPLGRTSDLAVLKRAYLALEAQERSYSLSRETVSSEVRSLLRRLRRIEQSIAIQRRIITASRKRMSVAEARFRQGRLPSRDVVEAQRETLQARNTLAQYEVDYAMTELEFLKAVGVLRVDARGKVLRDDTLGDRIRGSDAESGASEKNTDPASTQSASSQNDSRGGSTE